MVKYEICFLVWEFFFNILRAYRKYPNYTKLIAYRKNIGKRLKLLVIFVGPPTKMFCSRSIRLFIFYLLAIKGIKFMFITLTITVIIMKLQQILVLNTFFVFLTFFSIQRRISWFPKLTFSCNLLFNRLLLQFIFNTDLW